MPIPPQFLKKTGKKKKKVDTHSPKPDGSKLTSPFDKDGKGYDPAKDPSKSKKRSALLDQLKMSGK